MSEETKHPNTPNVMTEQDKGRCAPALGSETDWAQMSGYLAAESLKVRMAGCAWIADNLKKWSTMAMQQAQSPNTKVSSGD
jgi:hypothetical protein